MLLHGLFFSGSIALKKAYLELSAGEADHKTRIQLASILFTTHFGQIIYLKYIKKCEPFSTCPAMASDFLPYIIIFIIRPCNT
jgi:hypothetical protein